MKTIEKKKIALASPALGVKILHQGLVFIALTVLMLATVYSIGAQDGAWAAKAPMPLHLVNHAAAGVNGIVYVVGGHEPHSTCSYLNTLLAYDPATDVWTSKTPMPTGRDVPGAGVVNGLLYVAGGGTGCGEYTSVLEAYDPATDSWQAKQPMSKARYGPGVAVVNDILYAVGGEVGRPDSVQTVEAYDPVTDAWTSKAPMLTGRYGFAVGVVGGTLYAVGGTDGISQLATVEAYDPIADSWSTKASLPAPTYGLSVGTVNGVLYAVGGANPSAAANLWAYSASSDAWRSLAPMPTPRFLLTVADADGVLYALGGANDTSFPDFPFLASNEAFTPEASVDITPPVIACPGDLAASCSVDLLVPLTFSVAATDDFDPSPTVTSTPPSGSLFPIGQTTVTSTATDASGHHSSCSFTVIRASLGFAGFLAPISGADATGGSFASPARTFKMNSTIPVKFTASCGGLSVSAGAHHLRAIKYSSATSTGTPIDATPQDAATTGNQFRLVDGHWQFNLDTKATGMSAGIWQLTATLSDGSQHQVWIQLK